MKLTNRAEEIMEIMWVETIEKGQKYCDATLMRDSEALHDLVAQGYISEDNRKVRLTDKGRDEARSCIRRHRLAERLLADVLAVEYPVIHETGCRLEHLLHRELEENICTLLGHPGTCPHGSSIPEGPCCREARSQANKIIVRLSEMEPGEGGVIAYLQMDDKDALQKLLAMGALPGAGVTLCQRVPSTVFEIGRSQFAIDTGLASRIHIRRSADRNADGRETGIEGFGRRCMRRMMELGRRRRGR